MNTAAPSAPGPHEPNPRIVVIQKIELLVPDTSAGRSGIRTIPLTMPQARELHKQLSEAIKKLTN